MKALHIGLALAALMGSVSVLAAPVGRRQAMKVAGQFVRLDEAQELRAAQHEARSGHQPAYHIFNDRDWRGFVIISGDDAGAPVLGYAPSGRLDVQHLPEQLAALLRVHEARVSALRAAALTPGEPAPNPKPRARAVRGPLLRSLWNQDEPFNSSAPTIGGRHTASGCVATAMAQMMYHHRWPERGKGGQTYTPQHPEIGQLSVDFSQSVYDWAAMRDEYAYEWRFDGRQEQPHATWTEREAQAVAKLMLDIGVSVRTGYNLASSGGSGSNMFDAARALREHFSYQTRSLYRDNVPHRSFLSAIREELDGGYPILMAGSHAYAGHAWVIDGYDENGFLHVNWGWGGLSNGYFALSFMTPDKVGTGGDIGGYNQGQMIILIRPERAGAPRFPEHGHRFSYIAPGAGLRINPRATSAEARRLGIYIERLGNRLSTPLTGEVALSLRNAAGEELALARVSGHLPELSRDKVHSRLEVVLSLPSNLPDGTYYIHTVGRAAGSGATTAAWAVAEYDEPLEVAIRSGQIVLPEAHTQAEGVELTMTHRPELLTPLWQGEEATLKLGIKNPTNHATFFGDLVMRLRRGAVAVAEIPVAQYQFFDHSTYDALSTISVGAPHHLEAGVYEADFVLRMPSHGGGASAGREYQVQNPFGTFHLEILSRAGKPILELAPDWHSPRGETNSCALSIGGEPWTGPWLSLEKLGSQSLDIRLIITNSGDALFAGAVHCEARDATTGAAYRLATAEGVRLSGGGSGAFAEVLLSIPRAVLEPLVGKSPRFVLRFYTEVGGRKYDIWARDVHAPSLVLTMAGEDPTTLGVEALTASGASLQCYPSPARDVVYVRGAAPGRPLQLITLSGQTVLHLSAPTAEDLSLSLGHLPRGIYFLRSGREVTRLVLH